MHVVRPAALGVALMAAVGMANAAPDVPTADARGVAISEAAYPGTIVLEIDQVRRMIYVHVIDVSSERSVAQFHRQVAQVEKLLIAAFEREQHWRPAAKDPVQ